MGIARLDRTAKVRGRTGEPSPDPLPFTHFDVYLEVTGRPDPKSDLRKARSTSWSSRWASLGPIHGYALPRESNRLARALQVHQGSSTPPCTASKQGPPRAEWSETETRAKPNSIS